MGESWRSRGGESVCSEGRGEEGGWIEEGEVKREGGKEGLE